ncbi:hypothetical protein [Gardnerella leopoldii]|uniref:hypothetical protein n=1 Tax=Gardnerella leopoldii TaxID=2792978 RepID=UPI0039EEA910
MGDFKVSKEKLDKDQTLQLLMYWRMGLHSIHPEFQNISLKSLAHCGFKLVDSESST